MVRFMNLLLENPMMEKMIFRAIIRMVSGVSVMIILIICAKIYNTVQQKGFFCFSENKKCREDSSYSYFFA